MLKKDFTYAIIDNDTVKYWNGESFTEDFQLSLNWEDAHVSQEKNRIKSTAYIYTTKKLTPPPPQVIRNGSPKIDSLTYEIKSTKSEIAKLNVKLENLQNELVEAKKLPGAPLNFYCRYCQKAAQTYCDRCDGHIDDWMCLACYKENPCYTCM